MSTRSQTLRNTVFSSISIYTEYFIGMVTSILIARHMGPGDYGVYGMLVWMGGLGVAIINAGIASGTIKFVAELRGSGREGMIRPLVKRLHRIQHAMMLGVVLIGLAIFEVYRERLAPDADAIAFGLLLLAVCLRAPYMLNVALAKGYENFRAVAGIAVIAAPTNLLLIIGALLLDVGLEGYMLVYAISGLVFFLVSHWRVRHLLPDKANDTPVAEDMLPRIRRYLVLVAIIGMVSFFTASEVEVLFLNLWDTSAAAGNFRVAHQLAASATLLVPGVFAMLLLPMMSKALGEGIEQARRRFGMVTRYLLMLAAPLAAFAATLATPVTHALYGSAYDSAGFALAWCLGACAFTAAGTGASSLLLGADRQMSLLVLTLSCAALKLTAGAWLAAHYGLHGAVASYVGVAAISLVGYMIMGIRVSGARLPWGLFVRILLAAALAGVVARLVANELSPWPALLAGGMVLLLCYLLFSLLFGCWSREDVGQVGRMAARTAIGRSKAVAGFLGWSERRAHGASDE